MKQQTNKTKPRGVRRTLKHGTIVRSRLGARWGTSSLYRGDYVLVMNKNTKFKDGDKVIVQGSGGPSGFTVIDPETGYSEQSDLRYSW